MKQIFSIVVFLLLSAYSYSQQDDDIEIIKLAVGVPIDSAFIYAKETIGWSRIESTLKGKRQFIDISRDRGSNNIRFSGKERRSILQQIAVFRSDSIEEIWFPGAKRIPVGYLIEFVRKTRFALREKNIEEGKPSGMPPYVWGYGFSKPIYFRNNTLCILYHLSMCGGECGHDAITIFRRENNHWINYMQIAGGDY